MRSGTLAVWLLLRFGESAAAQTTGSISGRVLDTTGAPIPGVMVDATSDQLQGARRAVTAADGIYRFAGLPPGRYVLLAAITGFHTTQRVVMVAADSKSMTDLTLPVAAQEQVVVTDAPPRVDTSSTTTGSRYSDTLFAQLPSGRSYAELVRANPGVASDRGPTQGRSLALSIYGSTSLELQWLIDGINTTGVNRGAQTKALNADFVQELEVKTGGYQAEYGRALGGVISVVTKSGGNQFHGGGFAYYDSESLQANRVFAEETDSRLAGMRVADYRRGDYGVDIGGFLLKDTLWFFAGYDGVAYPAHVSRYVSSETVPDTMRFPLRGVDTIYSGKLTWNLNPSTSVVATGLYDPTTNKGAGSADPRQGDVQVQPITSPDPGTWYSERSIGAADYALRVNRLIGASGLVTVQATRHQERYALTPSGPGLQPAFADVTCLGGTPERPCDPPDEPNFTEGGFGFVYGPEQNLTSRRGQIRGDGTFYAAAHELKVGADYQSAWTSAVGYYSGGQSVQRLNDRGQVYYVHNFFVRNESDLTPISIVSRGTTRDYGAYVQDSWRALPGVTVDAGLRFDRELIVDGAGTTVFPTDSWQPRLGVVWDPARDGTTKVYAFAGLFSYGLPTDLILRSYGAFAAVTTFNFDRQSTTQNPGVLGHPSPEVFSFGLNLPVDKPLSAVSQQELTVGIEKMLGASLWLSLKGTYRRLAQAIEDRADLDPSAPESGGSNFAFTNPGSTGRFSRGDFHSCTGLDEPFNRCDAAWASPLPAARRVYRGIELAVRETLSTQAWLQASYVYSSLEGNYEGETNAGNFGYSNPGTSNAFDFPALTHNAYGRLFLDRPHQLRLDGFYTLPFRLSVGLQFWLRSGAPLDRLGYFNRYDGPSVFLVPRGSADRMPMEWDANLTLSYPVRFDPVTVTLQAYLFNVFNRQIPTQQDTVWSSSPPSDYPTSLFDPAQQKTNSEYGKVTARSDPRLFRAAIRISF